MILIMKKARNIIAIKGADIKKIIPKLKNVCPIGNRLYISFHLIFRKSIKYIYRKTNFIINFILQ